MNESVGVGDKVGLKVPVGVFVGEGVKELVTV